jgi:hypothetical protein
MSRNIPLILFSVFLFSYATAISWPWASIEEPLPDAITANLWDFTPDERQALSSGRDSLGICTNYLTEH